ncbi:hypothetical protein [Methylobacterium sp. WL116]|uniref:hypothetical protein n=1 Tax=Methylobacterium sp. WL116 TaxID=2603889 RepID=UPI0011C88A05|nr:hypothetical protein [Methylobacterium sp. WL116]TXM95374.1 hypothetical protein FV223_01070 [Methylobacterium sp. WL116]
MLDELPTLGEKIRFLRESGLEFADFGLPNWVGGTSADAAVQLHQAVFGSNRQANGRAWAGHGASEYLTSSQFRKGYNAIAYANCVGEVMNAFISISWSTAGIVAPDAVMAAQIRYLELLRKWLLHRGVQPAWVWVIENGKTYGLHSHILLRVPHHMREAVKFQAETAVATIAARPLKKPRRGTKGDQTVHVICRRDNNIRAQWRLYRYISKGLKPTTRELNPELRAKQIRIEKVGGLKLRRQGLVVRQRLGVARGLSTQSRQSNSTIPDFLDYALEHFGTAPGAIFTDAYFQEWCAQQWSETADQRAAANAAMMKELTSTLNI